MNHFLVHRFLQNNMKKVFNVLTFFCLIMSTCVFVSAQQKGNENFADSIVKPIKKIGNADLYYSEKADTRYANVYTFLNADILSRLTFEHSAEMSIFYAVQGKNPATPASLSVTINSYSMTGLKFSENRNVSIYADKQLIFSSLPDEFKSITKYDLSEITPKDLRIRNRKNPPQTAYESFTIREFKYEDFDKIIKAKKVYFMLGTTKINLNGEAKNAFENLYKTMTKKIKS